MFLLEVFIIQKGLAKPFIKSVSTILSVSGVHGMCNLTPLPPAEILQKTCFALLSTFS
jgi:hypothetical protein